MMFNLFQFLYFAVHFMMVSSYYTGYQDMLNQVNAKRKAAGLTAYCGVAKLMKSTQTQSQYQATTHHMTHDGPVAGGLFDRFTAVGFDGNAVAENVGMSSSDSVSAMMTLWMNSAGHKANILGPYKYFGSARVKGSDGLYYFTQEFGSTWTNKETCMSNAKYLRADGVAAGTDFEQGGEVVQKEEEEEEEEGDSVVDVSE